MLFSQKFEKRCQDILDSVWEKEISFINSNLQTLKESILDVEIAIQIASKLHKGRIKRFIFCDTENSFAAQEK